MGFNKLKQKVATALLIVMSTSATLSVAAATTSVQAKISSSATLREAVATPSDSTSGGNTSTSGGNTSSSGGSSTATPSDAEKPGDSTNTPSGGSSGGGSTATPSDAEKPGDDANNPNTPGDDTNNPNTPGDDTNNPNTPGDDTNNPSNPSGSGSSDDTSEEGADLVEDVKVDSVDIGEVKVAGLDADQKMSINEVNEEDVQTDSTLKSVLRNLFSKERFTQIKFFGIDIDVTNHRGNNVKIYLDAPTVLEIKNPSDRVIGIHFTKNGPKSFKVDIRKNGDKFRMSFSTDSFSPFYFVKVEASEEITSGGSSSSGGGRSSSATREATMNGKWVAENGVWKFLKDNGEYATNTWGYIKGQWYFFDAQGNMVTGWYLVNDQWYYMNPAEGTLQGAMLTGWVMDSNFGGWFYLNASGAMVTGWNEINGKWYYLNPISNGTKGIMAANTYVDGYYVGADGAWIQ